MAKLHFKTTAAANLFAVEITGQLSDGAWENTRPLDHWKFWCNAEVVVDGKIGYEGSPVKTNYNLKSLKKCVKEEMKNAIRITKMPWFTMADFSEMTRTLSDTCYLKFMPSCLEYRNITVDPEKVKEMYKYTIASNYEKAIKAIGSYCTDEFKQMVQDEIVRQLIINDQKCHERHDEYVKKCWEKLAPLGITDIDTFHKMIETINAVNVSDFELDNALDEIKWMMTTAL